ncbi:MAG: GNAT family N-acetyltransferase [Firmicutes bacterium]|nr:GNAT family N-acetyltransferase [Bacillota bacterium]
MKIVEYENKYKNQVIELILNIQNDEYGINLGIDEQPDLLNIEEEYIAKGGNFWIGIDVYDEVEKVIGTIALLKKEKNVGILKKFFVDSCYRGREFGVGSKLFDTLLTFSKMIYIKHIVLDTPAVAVRSHSFYRRVGFRLISRVELPIEYTFPDRDSLLFMLDIGK